MDKSTATIFQNALISGAIAGAATALVAIAAAKREGQTAAAPLNAVSHAIWPDEAPREDDWSGKYTGTGIALNSAACVFWAALYEALIGSNRNFQSPGAKLAGGAFASAIAYVTDYHVVPERLTPGFEKRLSNRALGAIYAALAASLPLRAVASRWLGLDRERAEWELMKR